MVSTINCHLVIIFMVVLAISGDPDARKMTLVTAALHRPMASGGHHCTLAYNTRTLATIQAHTPYQSSTKRILPAVIWTAFVQCEILKDLNIKIGQTTNKAFLSISKAH